MLNLANIYLFHQKYKLKMDIMRLQYRSNTVEPIKGRILGGILVTL